VQDWYITRHSSFNVKASAAISVSTDLGLLCHLVKEGWTLWAAPLLLKGQRRNVFDFRGCGRIGAIGVVWAGSQLLIVGLVEHCGAFPYEGCGPGERRVVVFFSLQWQRLTYKLRQSALPSCLWWFWAF
jgi:hypothetical protein